MATTTGSLVSVEEYLKSTSKPNSEYIDGEVRPKPMPTGLHGTLQLRLGMLLLQQGSKVGTEVTVRLSPTKYLIPDIIAADSIPSTYPTDPVTLCVEILSPEDRLGSVMSKCEDYHAWGVPYCWIIDPVKQTAWEYDANGEPVKIDVGGTPHAGSLLVHLPDLFAAKPQ
jgi:Uma2 family endonuclease